jgi:uncharacterized protein YjbI with pentapeptide repeats
MANDEHVAILKQGVNAWNTWRREHPVGYLNLSGAYLRRADLEDANLRGVDLSLADLWEASLRKADLGKANLSGAHLHDANLSLAILYEADLGKANLSGTNLYGANLHGADLSEADLSLAYLGEADLGKANLSGTNLHGTNLHGANLKEAVLQRATLINTNLTDADLTGCRIYGVSAWGLELEGAKQQNLIITPRNENQPVHHPKGAATLVTLAERLAERFGYTGPDITVDNIEVAQFIYLMLHNQKIRDVIDTITSKAVLILGRFTDERKAVLDALRDELRKRDYLPILFDFSVPATRDITETISLLARMARFVVADITDAKSIPQELAVIVPDLPSVPVQPLLLEGSAEYGMFEHFKRYPWVLETHRYPSSEQLIADLVERVIVPAEKYIRGGR